MSSSILEIRRELKKNIDLEYKKGEKAYFKEKIKSYGVRTPIVRGIAKKYFSRVRDLDKKEVFSLCEELLKSGYGQEATIAFDWAFRFRKEYRKEDFKIFENWLKKYISDWGKCDDFSTHIIHYFVENFPETIPRIKKWAYSDNMWLRRASAVSFITSKGSWFIAKHTLSDIFDVALILLKDKEDLVQKGYGWMLKSASAFDEQAVFNFVMKHKREMPRTALRYAIEYMPKDLKRKAMEKA